MDNATRFVLAFRVSPVKPGYDAAPLPEAAKKAAGFILRMFVTVGIYSFVTAFRKALWTAADPPIRIREIRLRGLFCNTNGQDGSTKSWPAALMQAGVSSGRIRL